MNSPKTADLVDEHDAKVKLCQLQFQLLGARRRFHGRIATVKCFEDNALLKQKLGEPGEGRVLIVDAGASLRVAVAGDLIGGLALKNGWSGLIINGAIRDSVQLGALEFSVCALGRSPKKSGKRGTGETDVTVNFGGVDFVPGHFVYADDDGVLVSAEEL
jgi:regulator of ribonuclease activity A